MLDLQDRLDELKGLGLYRRMRMVSGPQGPRVVLDGKPVLLLCSNNYLGLADHPRVRERGRHPVVLEAARGVHALVLQEEPPRLQALAEPPPPEQQQQQPSS